MVFYPMLSSQNRCGVTVTALTSGIDGFSMGSPEVSSWRPGDSVADIIFMFVVLGGSSPYDVDNGE
jgi:hypothetical protein